ncbi:MAG: N-acetylmuramoyl-L-alanine amidase [Dethiobacter sp.]|jgi:N-acetylmuramoyl-L-alanine amidase|nr:N-acetylmuramoyl-L-alanine amidase [Dethiobacter sp.]MBS4022672.1 N-acetylmuramoyl-L-alanine amidase [Dethiobacter sp.]
MHLKQSRYITVFVLAVCLVFLTFSFQSVSASSSQSAEIVVQALNVRSGAGTSSERINTVSGGTFLNVLSRQGDWLRVRLPQLGEGWIFGGGGYVALHNIKGNVSVTIDALNVRSGPGTSFTRISQVTKSIIPFLEERDGWYRIVLPEGKAGWISGQYARPTSLDINSSKTAMINVPILNIRSGPATSYGIIRTGSLGEEFKVVNSVPGWLNIILDKSSTAWISASHTLIRDADGGSGAPALAGKTIVIDAGHGGSDPGAVGRNLRLAEKFVNLDTALRVAQMLENAGAKVILTRNTDDFITLSQRVNIAHANNADIFVSIHANAHTDRSIGGTETYYNTSFRSQDSFRLANVLQQELVRELKLRDIGVKTAGFHVIQSTRIPSALVELAFLSNPKEEELLNQASFRQRAADAVYRGIVRYFQ